MKRQRIRRHFGYTVGRLSRKAVIVTGGASPLGLLMAQGLAQEGASVLLVCHTFSQQAVMVDPSNTHEFASILWTSGDTRRRDYCRSVIDYAFQRFGRLDALINNADYEFVQTWPAQPLGIESEAADASIPVTGADEDASAADASAAASDTGISENVSENFNQAALGVMRPGGVLIHTVAPDRLIPLSMHPSLQPGQPEDAGHNGDTKRQLIQSGVRLAYLHPGSLWVASLFQHFPQIIPDEKAVQILNLIDFCISIISKE